jgi:hypothetical protein
MPGRQVGGRDLACPDLSGGQRRGPHHRRDVRPQGRGGQRQQLDELDEPEVVAYDFVDETRGLLSVGDIRKISARVSPDRAAVLMVVEHPWTTQLAQAVLLANGRIVVHERVPADVASAALVYDQSSQTLGPEGGGTCSDHG